MFWTDTFIDRRDRTTYFVCCKIFLGVDLSGEKVVIRSRVLVGAWSWSVGDSLWRENIVQGVVCWCRLSRRRAVPRFGNLTNSYRESCVRGNLVTDS